MEEGWEKPVFAPADSDMPAAQTVNSLLLNMPLEGELVRGFGLYEEPPGDTKMSYGILLVSPDEPSVHAPAPGYIKEIGEAPGGFVLVLEHRAGWETYYSHLEEVLVKEQDVVEQGQVIARAGTEQAEGWASLYFELRENGRPLDPLPLLTGR